MVASYNKYYNKSEYILAGDFTLKNTKLNGTE